MFNQPREVQFRETSADGRPAGVDINLADNDVLIKTRAIQMTQNDLPAVSIDDPRVHTVQPHESLWKICREDMRQQNGGRESSYRDIANAVNELAAANNINPNEYIHPGQQLRMPESWASGVATSAGENHSRETQIYQPPQVEHARIAPGEPNPNSNDVPRADNLPEYEGGWRNQPGEPGRNQDDDFAGNPLEQRSSHDFLSMDMYAIDKDGNNKASRKEIENFLDQYGSSLSKREVNELDRYARNADKIQNLVSDGEGPGFDGISQRDADRLQQLSDVAKFMMKNNNFDLFNQNGDRFLKKDEITNILLNANLSRDERTALNYLRDNYNTFEGGTNDETGPENSGITRADLRYFANLH